MRVDRCSKHSGKHLAQYPHKHMYTQYQTDLLFEGGQLRPTLLDEVLVSHEPLEVGDEVNDEDLVGVRLQHVLDQTQDPLQSDVTRLLPDELCHVLEMRNGLDLHFLGSLTPLGSPFPPPSSSSLPPSLPSPLLLFLPSVPSLLSPPLPPLSFPSTPSPSLPSPHLPSHSPPSLPLHMHTHLPQRW